MKAIILVFIILILVLLIFSIEFKTKHQQTKIVIRNTEIQVEVADSSIEQAVGLSGREKLAPDNGMLFVYKTPEVPCFWMKDMYFPIDIIWIDEHRKIIDISTNVQPSSYPNCFKPPSPVRYVLELNQGLSKQANFNIGDDVLMEGI